ncbi:PD-(D/E)XK nuclease family protein [Desulfosarcina sp. OttesenSCG-928-A07]|nr:PD-(D/E)XK nuclease family protein [Desulfosarcina sp. OttesenSCG-928-G17]MDL2329062.1 PD-(D/E)XK nuclease family protein [Desulfosarcina sp. OttesenSCG-928-A07]
MNDFIVIRASSMPELFDCPSRWEAKNIRKIRMPSSGNSVLGRSVHAATAVFDSAVLDGNPITIDDASGVVADTIRNPDEEVDWGEDKPQDAENIGIALTGMYCRQIAPSMDYVAVEATCERLEIIDIGIALTGTTDRVVKTADGHAIADIKTGKSAVAADGTVKTQGHAAQMAVYELIAESSTGIQIDSPAKVIGLQVAKTDKGRRAGVGKIQGGRELILGDEDSPGLLEHAAAIIKSGLFPGNPRSMMCHAKYCPIHGACKWRK